MRNTAFIDLNNLTYNATEIKKRLNKGVKFCAVVKADAYGHGASVVANALYNLVDCFAVAIVEEGVELRQSGIDKDVLVLTTAFKEDLERAIDYNLTLTVTSVRQIKDIIRLAHRKNKKVKIHIKYNTGMNRQGVDGVCQLKEILEVISRSKFVVLDGFYSHFSAPENKKSLNSALNKFLLAINEVKGYNKKVTYHISASGGLLQGVQLDMVRVGIMLYGYTPFKTDKIKLRKVMKVTAPVLCDRNLRKGDVLLYGDKKVKEDISIAEVRFGYADGLWRKESIDYPVNRCMDITAYKCGKKVKRFTVMSDAEKLANAHKTISYEVLTGFSDRLNRVYRR